MRARDLVQRERGDPLSASLELCHKEQRSENEEVGEGTDLNSPKEYSQSRIPFAGTTGKSICICAPPSKVRYSSDFTLSISEGTGCAEGATITKKGKKATARNMMAMPQS